MDFTYTCTYTCIGLVVLGLVLLFVLSAVQEKKKKKKEENLALQKKKEEILAIVKELGLDAEKEEILAKVIEFIITVKKGRIDAREITLESTFKDHLGFKDIKDLGGKVYPNVDFVELIMLLEEEFNIEISDEERDNRITTVGEAVEFLYSQSRLFDSGGDT